MKTWMGSAASRRRFLSQGAVAALAGTLGRRAGAFAIPERVCTLAAQQEVGPFYIAEERLRSNIREAERGIRLSLRIVVMDVTTCRPVEHAAVDVWQCNALGLYSGFTKSKLGGGGPGGPPPGGGGGSRPEGPPPCMPAGGAGEGARGPQGGGPPMGQQPRTDELSFLRGIQLTSAEGLVQFDSIFPGFYNGRTNHIHFRVRVGGQPDRRTYEGGHVSHTGQVFFPEELSAAVMARDPYRGNTGPRVKLDEDHVYLGENGRLSMSKMAFVEQARMEAGLLSSLVVAVDPSATPGPVSGGGPRPPLCDVSGTGTGGRL